MFFVTIVSGKFSKVIDDNLFSDTIQQLKKSINLRCGIPIQLLNLSYNGILLEDNKKISEYFIQSHDKVDLHLKLLEINFNKNGPSEYKWYVEYGVSVAELQKRIIGKINGTIFGKLDLISGNDIVNNSSFQNYLLKDGDILLIN